MSAPSKLAVKNFCFLICILISLNQFHVILFHLFSTFELKCLCQCLWICEDKNDPIAPGRLTGWSTVNDPPSTNFLPDIEQQDSDNSLTACHTLWYLNNILSQQREMCYLINEKDNKLGTSNKGNDIWVINVRQSPIWWTLLYMTSLSSHCCPQQVELTTDL